MQKSVDIKLPVSSSTLISVITVSKPVFLHRVPSLVFLKHTTKNKCKYVENNLKRILIYVTLSKNLGGGCCVCDQSSE